ncbi:AAA family ATPase [Campylobacter coli]|uniref:Chaperone protein ClpB n=3 Tax=Campylobacter coli TaxID=195 RepID=A0A654MJ48_CAMCO|nr:MULTISPECIES: AAA family ATPase [Campylobacter]EIA57399.1 ATP-dependent Clp protease, ATP-binding subunit ClpA [Campylobacter coli 2698]EIA71466.1 ATP-dependent Clp protease, ATP-binding subunit ClpA [Campylobacter coli 7--1]EIA73434.1 ATP-dependent Clp protease, ATP-binding subunit ClpA [Campylobacter coli 1891]EIB06218.1 ATP-dependent Clp protease, ATP-binding subunit ClpA [Campylobacter coli H6]AHK74930.1 ATP-dependent Clp protease ClpA [Campylobacter coli RM5611]
MKYQENLQKYLDNAKHLSTINRHEFTTCEHVLFAILKLSSDFKSIFEELADAEFELLESELKNYIAEKNQSLDQEIEPVNSIVLDEILNHKNEIKIIDFLEKLIQDDRTYSSFLLQKHGMNLEKIQDFKQNSEIENLNSYASDLTLLAQKGKIDPLIGRKFELERIIQILSRRKKNNPILIGEAGVGKTAIVEGLALAIAEKKVPKNLQNAKIFSLDIAGLLSGTKYRGDFEKRIKEVLEGLQKLPNAILFIDEIHTIVGAGATGESHTDFSNLLKPALSNGTLKCIGATTFMEYKNTFDKNKALSRRFAKINVDEPSQEEAFQILQGLKSKYEDFHKIKISDEVLQQAIVWGKKFFSDKYLPDSAIDLIDELGASYVLKAKTKKNADIKDLEQVLAKMTHHHKMFEFDQNKALMNLSLNLKAKIFGQDEVIDKLVATLKQSFAGFKNLNTPRGVFLFTGSSGVGKTELCKVLAEFLGLNLERFDMSEYAEKHSISKLIGSPAGYVGYEDGGLLSNAVRKNPFSLILFDEIEKAHPDLSNTFLQIFDNAELTDNSGLKADFKNTIIIMTSNLGLKESNELGFLSKNEEKSNRAIKDFFAPEFINRIDKILHFNDLDDTVLVKIIQKELDEISKNLKNIQLVADEKAKLYLAKKAYNKEFGVRLLKRIISEEIGEKISDEILFGKLKKGGIAKIKLNKNGKLDLIF